MVLWQAVLFALKGAKFLMMTFTLMPTNDNEHKNSRL
jgi:hypothetical protein